MGEIAEYFKREKYITRRLSLLILGGPALLVPLVIASAHGHIPPSGLAGAMVAYIAFIGFAIGAILRDARSKYPNPEAPARGPLNPATRRNLQRRIWSLEFLVALYALVLLYELLQIGRDPWSLILTGLVVNFLFQAALIKAVLRLKRKLKTATSAATSMET